MSDPGAHKIGMGPGTAWALGIFAAFVFYFLSPGPVGKAIQMIAGPDPPDEYLRPFEIAYLPIVFVADRFPPLQEFYDWYFEVWGVET